MKIKSLWHTSNTGSEIKETREEFADKILIKSICSLISIGTERLVAKGNIPKDLYDSMTVPFQKGQFDFPIKYGYSLVGEVLSKNHQLAGKRVHLLHPHQDYCFVNEKDLFVIPDGVDSQTATLASNLETALNAVWDSGVSIGDKVLIVGFGLIGSLIARLLDMIPGTDLVIYEIDAEKIKMAKSLGFKNVINPSISSDDFSSSPEFTKTFDLAFHCSATSSGLQSCIDATGLESKIIELSWYGDKPVNIQFGGTFHSQRKQLISSQVSNLPIDRKSRWDYKRRKEAVFNLLKNPIFKHHISQNLIFADVPKFFDVLRTGEASELGVVINY